MTQYTGWRCRSKERRDAKDGRGGSDEGKGVDGKRRSVGSFVRKERTKENNGKIKPM